jgi:hypothetical protein
MDGGTDQLDWGLNLAIVPSIRIARAIACVLSGLTRLPLTPVTVPPAI